MGLYSEFSHKLAAHLAGFGWIGKSCLLITPEYGPRVRWVSILTDAPLKATSTFIASKCGKCNVCVDSCPVDAFTGNNFERNLPREDRFDAQKCQDHFTKLETKGKLPVCGMCLYSCPYGLKE